MKFGAIFWIQGAENIINLLQTAVDLDGGLFFLLRSGIVGLIAEVFGGGAEDGGDDRYVVVGNGGFASL